MSLPVRTSSQEHIFSYDFIRFVAIILVVFVHVTAQLKGVYNQHPTDWWVANLYDSFSRVCVPLFVMVSGALLLDPTKEESLVTFFRKRFKKVLIPFVIWGGIYLLWRAFYDHESFTLLKLVTVILQGPIYYHLWFLYMLIGLYLVTPLLRAFIKGASPQLLTYFLILWFVLTPLASLLNLFTHISLGINLFLMGGYLGYYLLGYVLTRPASPIHRLWPWALLALAGLLATLFGSYWLTLSNQGKYEEYFLDYLSPNIVLMALFAFEFLRRQRFAALQRAGSPVRKLILAVSSTSFSVYLMHIIVLEVLAKGIAGIRLSSVTFTPAIGIPLTVLVTLAICVPLTLLARKVPILRYAFQ